MAGEALSRPDGRAGNQIRPLVCTRSLLSRADGSAQWSQENSTVLAAVYGPKSVTGKKENPEYASLEVIWKPKSGLSGKFEKEAELIVKRSLESIILAALYPNLGISIILQVINDDGSVSFQDQKLRLCLRGFFNFPKCFSLLRSVVVLCS
jgi:exosome complex component RRP46